MKFRNAILLLISSFLVISCHVGRYFYWNFADTNDHNKFEQVPIRKGEVSSPFVEKNKNNAVPEFVVDKKGKNRTFEDALIKSGTAAFLVIKNDTIIYENYFDEYSEATDHPSFSVSKSFISALIGIALAEGKIQSIDDSIRKYLPDLDPSFDPVTIAHILNMQSGVKFSEGYFNPFGEVAKFYYGTNLKKFVGKLKVDQEPGTTWKYISGNSQLLSLVLESATQQSLHSYMEEKLWIPLGMEYDASWNIDSKKHKTAKAFCCLNARARDFAKFGQLYLNKGKWNGKQLVPEDWVLKTTTFNDAINHNIYAYQWWRNISFEELRAAASSGQGIVEPAESQKADYQARGILGQFIYVNPEKNMVIVRLGHKFGKINWASLFKEISLLN